MDIKEIEGQADFSLVKIKNGTPHCTKHGAMNKITKDGFWRCITVSGYEKIINGNSIGYKHIETVCRAGCIQTNNYSKA